MSRIWCSRFGRLIWPFLQLASHLRDTSVLQLLHARLLKNQNLIANKVNDVHEDVKKILAKTQRSATLPSSSNVVQQMPLKPAAFHGRDVIIEEITQWLLKFHWALLNNHSSRHDFYQKILSGFLVLKQRRQLSPKSFPPNCRYLEILGRLRILRKRRSFLYLPLPWHSPV